MTARQSDQNRNLIVLGLLLVCGLSAPVTSGQTTSTFRNTNSIVITDATPAAPYPSKIRVSGTHGVVSRVRVTLTNFSHAFPGDVDILLANPSGQAMILMSDVGGGIAVNDLALTFDEDAPMVLPSSSRLESGTYKPTNYSPSGKFDTFFDPAPVNPSYGTSFAVFYGLPASGDWALYVVDDAGGGTGTIASGWRLELTMVDPATAAELTVEMTDVNDPVLADEKLVYNITVNNLGPNWARNVVLTDYLPAGTELLFAVPSRGHWVLTNGTVVCYLQDLDIRESATVQIGITPPSIGQVSNRVVVTASSPDFYPANSTATEVTTVDVTEAVDLVVSMKDTPDPAVVATDYAYTITVSNRGPLTATGVVLTDALPGSASLVSATVSQGSYNLAGGTVVCALGSLATGSVATVTLQVRPSALGIISNSATATANEFDIFPGNSTAWESTTIYLPTDLSVRITDARDPGSLGSNLVYTIYVYNNGPGMASGVTLSNTVPVGISNLVVTASQGTYKVQGGSVICSVGNLAPNTTAQVVLSFRPMALGIYSVNAHVWANETDANPANNASVESTTVFPGGNGIVVTPSSDALELANAITAAGSTGIRVTSASIQAHSDIVTNYVWDGSNYVESSYGAYSSGLYSVINPPFTYNLHGVGVVLSSGNVLDYQTGLNTIGSQTTSFLTQATTNQERLLDPITASGGRTFTHYDVTQLDIEFDLLPGFDTVQFDVVFGSDEYPEFVNSSFIDGFGIYLNGVNMAFTVGRPVNINHPDMQNLPGTELDGVLAPNDNPLVTFTRHLGAGTTNNRLTFIICDTSDHAYDTTVYVSSLQGVLPPNADLALSLTGPTNVVNVGSNITYQITVTNLGPDMATEVVLTNLLPAGVSFVSAFPSQGSFSYVNGMVICDLFTLDRGRSATVSIVASPFREGYLTNVAMVSASQTDFGATNNTASASNLAVEFGTFLSLGAVMILDAAPAAEYPAQISIQNVSGIVTQMSVTLNSLSHGYPADLDILLVSPSGQAVMLMSDAGANWRMQDVTLKFSDQAEKLLSRTNPVVSGTFRPTNYSPDETMAAPAPPPPYGSSMSKFNGMNPNGVWSLYVVDDMGGGSGLLFGGWKLAFLVQPPLESAPALSIRQVGAQVVISWPVAAAEYRLEYCGALTPGAVWSPVSTQPTVANGRNIVTVTATGLANFYRLKKFTP